MFDQKNQYKRYINIEIVGMSMILLKLQYFIGLKSKHKMYTKILVYKHAG